MAAELTIRVALADQFSKAWKALQGTITMGSGRLGAAFGTLTRSVFNLRNAIVGGLVGVAAKKLLHAFAVDEAASAQFNDALRRGGKFSAEYSAELHKLASALQAVGTQGDDTILAASKLLAMNERIGTEAMPRAIRASVDLAAALGVDLHTATRLVSNAAAGMTSTFTRYGIKIDENVAKSGDFAQILTALERAVGGADAALAKTTAGSLKQLGNLWGDLKKKAGAFIAAILNSGLGDWIKATLQVLNRELGLAAEGFKAGSPAATAWADVIISTLEDVAKVSAAVYDGFQLLARPFAGMAQLRMVDNLEATQAAMETLAESMRALDVHVDGVTVGLRKAGGEFEKTITVTSELSGQMGADMPAALAKMARGVELNRAEAERLMAQLRATHAALTIQNNEMTAAAAATENTGTAFERLKTILAEIRAQAAANAAAEKTAAADAASNAAKHVAAVKSVGEAYREAQGFVSALSHGMSRAMGTSGIDALHARLAALPAEMQAAFHAAGGGLELLQQLEVQAGRATGQAAVSTVAYVDKTGRAVATMAEQWRGLWQGVANGAEIASAVAFKALESMASGVGDIVANSIDQVVSGQVTTVRELGRVLKDMFVDLARSILREMIALSVRMAIMAGLKALLAAEGAVWEGGFTPVRAFASGGIITQPTIGIVGEAGQNEAVVPLPDGRSIPVRMEGGGGGGTTNINFHIQATDARSFSDQLAQQEARRTLEGIIANALRTRPAFRNVVQGEG